MATRAAPAAPRGRGPLRRRPEWREDSQRSRGSSCSLSSARRPICRDCQPRASGTQAGSGPAIPQTHGTCGTLRAALVREAAAATARAHGAQPFGRDGGAGPKSSRVPAGPRCRSREHARHPPHQPLVCVAAVAPFGAPLVRSPLVGQPESAFRAAAEAAVAAPHSMADDLSWGAPSRAARRPAALAVACRAVACFGRCPEPPLRRCADDDEYEVPSVAKDVPVSQLEEEEEEKPVRAAAHEPYFAAGCAARLSPAPA